MQLRLQWRKHFKRELTWLSDFSPTYQWGAIIGANVLPRNGHFQTFHGFKHQGGPETFFCKRPLAVQHSPVSTFARLPWLSSHHWPWQVYHVAWAATTDMKTKEWASPAEKESLLLRKSLGCFWEQERGCIFQTRSAKTTKYWFDILALAKDTLKFKHKTTALIWNQ